MEVKVGEESVIISGFNDVEVFKIAMKIEKDGEKFYKSVLQKTKDARVIRTFNRLAEDEGKHYEMFKNMYESALKEKGIDPSSVDTEEDIFTYMETGIFSDHDVAKDLKDAVFSGEIVEIKSILFYKEIEKNLTVDSAKKAIKDVIEEEQMHLNILKSWEAAV